MPNQPNKQKSKQKQRKSTNKSSKQKNKKGSAKTPKTDLYDPRTTLTGDDLKKFLKSEVRLQTRPTIQANKRSVETLKDLLKSQTGQLTKLDQQAGKNTSQYYKDLADRSAQSVATSQALGSRLTGNVAGAVSEAGKGIQTASQGALAGLSADEALRGNAPSTARDELQAMIAQQQGYAAREGQALQAGAAGQANDWSNLIAGQGAVAQQRGGETLSDTHRDIANKITDLQNQYAPDIREAQGQVRDAKASRGDLRRSLLAELRGQERDYMLSKGALGIDKGNLALSAKTAAQEAKASKKALAQSKTGNPTLDVAKQYGKNARKHDIRALKSQLAVAKAQGKNKKAEQLRSRISQLEVIAAQQGAGGSGKLADYTSKQKVDARSRVRRTATADPSYLLDPKNRQKLINYLQSSHGINPQLSKYYIKKWLKNNKGTASAALDLGASIGSGANQ